MNFKREFIQVFFQFSADFIQPYFFQFALWCCNKLIGSYNMIEHCYPCISVDLHRGFTCLYDLHYLMRMPVRFMSTSWRLNWWGPSLSAVLFPVVADPGTVEQWRVPFPLAKRVAELVFPLVVHTPKSLEFPYFPDLCLEGQKLSSQKALV